LREGRRDRTADRSGAGTGVEDPAGATKREAGRERRQTGRPRPEPRRAEKGVSRESYLGRVAKPLETKTVCRGERLESHPPPASIGPPEGIRSCQRPLRRVHRNPNGVWRFRGPDGSSRT
jgi:hypothetical protein